MTAVAEAAVTEAVRANGPCSLAVMADGSQITNLSVHVRPDTGLSTYDYPTEDRVVLDVGVYLSEGVAVFLGSAALARLIDVLNDATPGSPASGMRRELHERRRTGADLAVPPGPASQPLPSRKARRGEPIAQPSPGPAFSGLVHSRVLAVGAAPADSVATDRC